MSFYCFITIKVSVRSQESSSSSLVVQTQSLEVHILFQWSEWPLGPEEQLHPLHLHLAAVARQQAALPDCARVLQVGNNRIFQNAKNKNCIVISIILQIHWIIHYRGLQHIYKSLQYHSLGPLQHHATAYPVPSSLFVSTQTLLCQTSRLSLYLLLHRCILLKLTVLKSGTTELLNIMLPVDTILLLTVTESTLSPHKGWGRGPALVQDDRPSISNSVEEMSGKPPTTRYAWWEVTCVNVILLFFLHPEKAHFSSSMNRGRSSCIDQSWSWLSV